MKKKLLLSLTLFIGFSLFAQTTVKMMDNTQYGPANSFQAKVNSIIPADYEAKNGDIITVTIAGTSDYDLSNFEAVFVDTREVAAWWTELSGRGALDDVTAGTSFSYSIPLVINNDAAGAGSDFFKLAFEGLSPSAIAASATEVTLTLTTLEISIESGEEGVITFTDNGNGAYQGEFPDTLAASPVVEVGDVVKVTIEGTSNVDITEFQTIIVDGTEAAGYWKELAVYTLFGADGTVTKDTPFTLTANITITEIPTGTGFKSQFVVITGKASAPIKLTLSNFTAEIVEGGSTPTSINKVATPKAISTNVFSMSGVNLGNVNSTRDLKDGTYIIVTKYDNGTVSKRKIVNKR